MLGVDQEQPEGIGTRGTKAGKVHGASCDPQRLKFENRVEHGDAGPDGNEDDHRARRALVDVLEQPEEDQREQDPGYVVEEVGDHAQTYEPGVRDEVGRGGGGVADDIDLRVHEALGKAPEDADEQIEDAGDSREVFRRGWSDPAPHRGR